MNKNSQSQSNWSCMQLADRIKTLKLLLNTFEEQRDLIASTITNEIGKPISQTKSEVEFFNSFNRWTLDNAQSILSEKIVYEDEKSIHKLIYEPIGKVAIILPWNSPYGLFSWKLFTNLVVGNTAIIKHSELCPKLLKLLQLSINKVNFPNGVIEFLIGGDKVGESLVKSNIDLICFTGSSETGEKIYKAQKKSFVKMIMELGGSNPAIVFEDTDIKMTANKIFSSRFANNGQNCDAVKRVLVHKNKYSKLIKELEKVLKTKIIGDPNELGTYFGPLPSMQQFNTATQQLSDALKKGAKVLAKLEVPDSLSGMYFPPTILTAITKEMKVWNEEVFAPILPIIVFDSESEAVKLANDTKYGLGAVIFSNNQKQVDRIASQLKCGNIEVNNVSQWIPQVPFGGYKASGIGRENGAIGLTELCQVKVVSFDKIRL